ncbi:MAG: sterol desaturase family protein, partial [Telluria sp.]
MKRLVEPAKAAMATVGDAVNETSGLLRQDGELKRGMGLVSGVVALCLGILCLLGVLAFHFPQYLTTPELRRNYNP